MAAVVVGHAVRKPGADVRDPELVDEKLTELERPGCEVEGPRLLGHSGEELRIKHPHHRHARSARADHCLRAVEHVERPPGHGAGLVPVAGIEARLPAAGLGRAKLARVPEPLEHGGHGHAHLRRHLVDKAGDKEADVHARSLDDPCSDATGR